VNFFAFTVNVNLFLLQSGDLLLPKIDDTKMLNTLLCEFPADPAVTIPQQPQ
jgi:hypothetical protein